MESMVTDWKFWTFIINTSITIGGFCLLKFNDFKHLEKDVTEIKESQKNTNKKVTDVQTDVAYIKGARETENRVLKILQENLKNK